MKANERMARELIELAREVSSADETNPDLMLQTIHSKLVRDIAKGRIDVQELAKKEMATRGLGKNGKWVGFEEAARQWRV